MSDSCPFSLPHPLDREFVENPYPFLSAAREQAHVCRIEELGLWLVTRYQDIKKILHDADTFSNANAQQPLYPLCEQAHRVLTEGNFAPQSSLSASDPPIHTRLRKYYSQIISFTPTRTAKLKPWIQEQISGLVDTFAGQGQVDLIEKLTAPLPAKVIFHLIGFPKSDTEMLLGWCEARLQLTGGRLTEDEQTRVAENMVKYWGYCEEFVCSRKENIKSDYTSELVRIHLDNPDALSVSEITTLIFALVFAGQETTNRFMGSMLRLLLERRERWEALLQDRSLIPLAVEECLRLEPSIAAWRRITTRDTEIAGVQIPKGEQLLLHLGSSGHDSIEFANGEEFDLRRSNSDDHLTLGYGIHFCLGAGLARVESQLVLKILLDRFPTLRLSPEQQFEYEPNVIFRGLKYLFVEWD